METYEQLITDVLAAKDESPRARELFGQLVERFEVAP